MLHYEPLRDQEELVYEEIPLQIVDRKDHVLRHKTIPYIKV